MRKRLHCSVLWALSAMLTAAAYADPATHIDSRVELFVDELQPGEMSIYYSQCYDHPTSHLARSTLRTDGFVSAHADAKGGGIVTKPLIFKGKEVVINYATSAAGHVQVEIQDESGNPIAGFGMEACPVIYGDEIERVVQWNAGGDVSALAGKPVRLKFGLRDADLYSYRFRE